MGREEAHELNELNQQMVLSMLNQQMALVAPHRFLIFRLMDSIALGLVSWSTSFYKLGLWPFIHHMIAHELTRRMSTPCDCYSSMVTY